jgi:4-amino-4-deoxy-L-arabinose transferase-like glycosyltransferase
VIKTTKASRPFVVFVACFVALLPGLLQSVGFDNGIFQGMAYQWYAFDKLPYLGSWDQNFPGGIYIHYLSFLLFGMGDSAFRLTDILFHALNATLIFVILRRWVTDRIAFSAAILGIALYLAGGTYLAGQRDGFASTGFLTALYLSLLLKNRERNLLVTFGMGLCAAYVFSFRMTYALFAVVLLYVIWRDASNRWRAIVSGCTGFIIGILVLFFPFISSADAWHAFVQACWSFNADLYGTTKYRVSTWVGLKQPQEVLINFALLVLCVNAMPGFARALRLGRFREAMNSGCRAMPTKRECLYLLLVYLSIRIPIWMMGKFMVYHYEPLVIMIGVGLALAGAGVINLVSHGKRTRMLFPAIVLAIYLVALPWSSLSLAANEIALGRSEPLRAAYLEQGPATHAYKDELAIAHYLNGKSDSAQVVYFTVQGVLAWRVHKPLGSRFHTFFSLAMQKPDGGYTPYQLDWHREVADSLSSPRTKYVVIGANPPTAPFIDRAPGLIVPEIPVMWNTLLTQYRPDTTISSWDIWVKK